MPPRFVDDPGTVARFVREKQALEVRLAWELLDIFNTNQSLVGPIRDRAHAALVAMWTAYNEYDWLRGAIQKVLLSTRAEQARMALALDYDRQNRTQDRDLQPAVKNNFPALRCGTLHQMMVSSGNFDLQDCCWVIRMYGEFVEQLAKVRPPAGVAAPAPDPRNANILALNMLADQMKRLYRRGFQWKSKVERFPPPAGELRGKEDELAAGLGGFDGFIHNFMERTRTQDALPWAIDALSQPYEFVRSLKGGISIFRKDATDTTLKIDRVFGLLPGATISGTTADLMYFMDTFASGDRDPIYYLAAAAGIVSQGHHTILEVALPLALNGWVDYSIGFYTSLMPTGHRPGRAATMHLAQGAIWDALDKAERDPDNRLMLVYYKAPNQYGGCYLFDRADMHFKLLATADDNLVRTFDTRFPNQWVTHEQVWNWFHLYYPSAPQPAHGAAPHPPPGAPPPHPPPPGPASRG